MGSTDFELQAKVTSNGLYSYDTHYVSYNSRPKVTDPSLTEDTPLPEDFILSQNFPNPFNPETEIRFGLPEDVHVQLVIIDLLGREVRKLVDGDMEAGYHPVVWDGKDHSGHDVPSGIYVYRIVAGNFQDRKKLTLIR